MFEIFLSRIGILHPKHFHLRLFLPQIPATIPLTMKAKTIAFLFLLLVALIHATAQVPEDRGAMGFAQALNRLDVIASVLHTACSSPRRGEGFIVASVVAGHAIKRCLGIVRRVRSAVALHAPAHRERPRRWLQADEVQEIVPERPA